MLNKLLRLKTVRLLISFFLLQVILPDSLKADIDLGLSSSFYATKNVIGPEYSDYRGDTRLMFNYNQGNFSAEAHYLVTAEYFNMSSFAVPIIPGVESDRYSLLRLSKSTTRGDTTINQSIDRLNVSYNTDNYGVYLGRTAKTWSRGRIFHVTDFFNPTVPGLYDTSYKQGTDLIGFNYNININNYIEVAANPQRNYDTLDVTGKDTNIAARYVFTTDTSDFSVMMAQYLRDYAVGGGFSIDFLYSTVLRGDVSIWDPEKDDKTYGEAVIGLERNFLVFDRTWTLFGEYYYNGFGSKEKMDQDYMNEVSDDVFNDDPTIITNTLMKRLQRSDTYILGRNYMGLGLSAELSDYITGGANSIINLYDGSSLDYFSLSYNLSDHLTLSLVGSFSLGAKNTEFGPKCEASGNDCEKSNSLVMIGISLDI